MSEYVDSTVSSKDKVSKDENKKISDPVLVAFESEEQMNKYHNSMHILCEFIVSAAKRGVYTKEELSKILDAYNIVYNGKKKFGE